MIPVENWTVDRNIKSLMFYSSDKLKPKTKTKNQNIFVGVNENLTTFLYTLKGATRKQKEKKKFSLLKCIQKSNVILKNWGFSI